MGSALLKDYSKGEEGHAGLELIRLMAAGDDFQGLRALREQIDRELQKLPGGQHDDRYRLMQHLNRGMRALRDAEDFARLNRPGWPTADRIRGIHQQLTDDVIRGKTTVPSLIDSLCLLPSWTLHGHDPEFEHAR